MPDSELLKLRFKDLKVTIVGTWLERCLKDLHDELAERGLRIRPHAWMSNEWFSPDDTPGIAIPFYLAHPRWRELFGPSSRRYPRYYRPNPASRRYVNHLPLWYAQSHPDEDFAETFAVWLTPRSNWRRRYARWPALKKLQYVDELMAEIAGQKPLVTRRLRVEPLSQLTQTLAEHYEKKQAHHAIDYPKIYDRDLRRIFSADPRHRRSPAASTFLRRNRAKIRQLVSKWTGEYELTLDSVFDDMIGRCRELKLRAVGSERQLRMEFIVLLTAKTVHSLYSPSRRQWLAL